MMHEKEISLIVGDEDPAKLEGGQELLVVLRSRVAVTTRRQDFVSYGAEA